MPPSAFFELSPLVKEALELVAEAVVVRDQDGTILFWNEAAHRLYGWAIDDVCGKKADVLLSSSPPFDTKSLNEGSVANCEMARVSATGSSLVVRSVFKAKRGKNGTIHYIVETAREVFEKGNPARTEEEGRYRNLFHAMTAAFFDIDVSKSLDLLEECGKSSEEGVRAFALGDPAFLQKLVDASHIVEVNDHVAQIFGFTAEDRLETLNRLWPKESNELFLELLLSQRRGTPRLTREVHLMTRSGEALYGVLSACLIPTGIGKGRVMIGIVDTTELKHAKDVIEREREHYRALFFNMPMAFLRVNSDALKGYYRGIGLVPGMNVFAFMAENPAVLDHASSLCFIEEANPQASVMLGASQPSDLAGMSISFAWKARPDTLIAILAAGLEGAEFEAETQMNTLDGRIIDVLFASAAIQEGGRRLRAIGMIDIGGRLAAQEALERMQAEFARASRISLLGELSASIVHEISQPLVAIAATGETGVRWLDRDQPDVEQARASLDRIVSYAQRASGIITRVRQMASGCAPVLSAEPLGAVVVGALQLIEAQARSQRVELIYQAGRGDDIVDIDRTQIEQVVVNLVVNAIQAISAAGSCKRLVGIRVEGHEDRVECIISDSGPGIADDLIDQVFERFVSSKPEGTGLGLAVCRSIVQAHFGEISVEGQSTLGGARFRFHLPKSN